MLSTNLSCQKNTANSHNVCHFQHGPDPQAGWGGTQRRSEAVLPKRPGETLQTHPNYKCKIKGNGSKSRFGPQQEGRHVCKLVPVRARVSTGKSRCGVKPQGTEGKAGLRPRVPSGTPELVPRETRGSAHDHRLAITTDILTRHDQEGLKGQEFTTRIFQQP